VPAVWGGHVGSGDNGEWLMVAMHVSYQKPGGRVY